MEEAEKRHIISSRYRSTDQRRRKEGIMASSASNKQQHQAEQPPRPASRSSSQFSSHGRGGAGNMADARQSPRVTPSDLETPVLKKPVVTTGRGGTGNMAKNDDPVETRMRQDVEG